MRAVSVIGFEEVDPGLVGRCGWEVEQTRRDVELLAWAGRFRFVSAQAISERFAVSWQQANARVRRLERRGLLGTTREHVSQPRAIFLTGKGHELLGWERRRAPRAEVQREHEAAIVWLATQLERDAAFGTRVLTERECRQLEARDQGRFSVEVAAAGRSSRRWPDLVVEDPGGRRAIEIEFAPKGTRRRRGIVEAYEFGGPYAQVVFLVKSAALGRRIRAQAGGYRPLGAYLKLKLAEIRVEPWTGLPAQQRAALGAALARKTS
jgi:hypothetical protein